MEGARHAAPAPPARDGPCPAGAVAAVPARFTLEYRRDPAFAAGAVFLSTLLPAFIVSGALFTVERLLR